VGPWDKKAQGGGGGGATPLAWFLVVKIAQYCSMDLALSLQKLIFAPVFGKS
jgi:hypothetical protein